MQNFKFTFETQNDYINATKGGYIESFDIVRVSIKHDDGSEIDFPVKSREEFNEVVSNVFKKGNEFIKMYQAEHSYDIMDYCN